uniref:Uncharacterized protein n=1 Tax=Ditylenchus dipsaci TaxID=166011 RepID=A0A915EBW1_9BILA
MIPHVEINADLRSYLRRWLRQQDRILNLPWKPNVKRSEKSNVIDVLVSGMAMNNGVELISNSSSSSNSLSPHGGISSTEQWSNNFFTEPVQPFTLEERRAWLSKLMDVSVSSDAFFPFRDNIDCARQVSTKSTLRPTVFPLKLPRLRKAPSLI